MVAYKITGAIAAQDKYMLENMKTHETVEMNTMELVNGINGMQFEVINAKKRASQVSVHISFVPVDDYYLKEYARYQAALLMGITAPADGFGTVDSEIESEAYLITEQNYISSIQLTYETIEISTRTYIGSYPTFGGHFEVKARQLVYKSPECFAAVFESFMWFAAETVQLKNMSDTIDFDTFKAAVEPLEWLDFLIGNKALVGNNYNKQNMCAIIYNLAVECDSSELDEFRKDMENELKSNIKFNNMKLSTESLDISFMIGKLEIRIAMYNASRGITDKENLDTVQTGYEGLILRVMKQLDDILGRYYNGGVQHIVEDGYWKVNSLKTYYCNIYAINNFVRIHFNRKFDNIGKLTKFRGKPSLSQVSKCFNSLEGIGPF